MIHNHKGQPNVGTIGNSPAAIKLVEILLENENRKYLGFVSKRIAVFNRYLNILSIIKDVNTRPIGHILFNKFKNDFKEFPESFQSFAINVLHAKYKSWCRDNMNELKT